MNIPYVGFSNDTLAQQPRISLGDKIKCPHCGEPHAIEGGKNEDGKETDLLLFFKCDGCLYLAGVDVRLTIDVESVVSGTAQTERSPK